MTWDVLGGRVQRKIFSTFDKVHRATDLLLLAFPHGFPRRGFGVAATAQLVVNCAFALCGSAKKPNLGHNTHAPLKVLCNPDCSSFPVLEIPSTKAGEHLLKKKRKAILMNWHLPNKNSVTKILQPFLPKSEPLQSCHPGTRVFTCACKCI